MNGQLALLMGTEQAAERAMKWTAEARAWIERLPIGEQFSIDDVTNACGMPPGLSRNACGALLHQLAKADLIQAVGFTVSRRPERRGAVVRVWKLKR
jgi:hypothetical protein